MAPVTQSPAFQPLKSAALHLSGVPPSEPVPARLQAYNIAAIWDIPVVFVIENNHYGMGTSDRRASKSAQYYTRGDYIPGVWVDGMDALSVKSATAFAKQHVLQHGPLMLEMVRLYLPLSATANYAEPSRAGSNP